MRELVAFTWNYFNEHPEFLSLLGTENLHRAKHLKTSKKIRELHSPLVGIITALLERGVKAKVFREGVDPVQLYITIASLGFFYMSNRFTLSTIFGRDLGNPEALAERGPTYRGRRARLFAAVSHAPAFAPVCTQIPLDASHPGVVHL